MSLKVHDTFLSWDEFFQAVEIHCNKTFQPMVKHGCKLTVTANTKIKVDQRPYPEMFKYVYYNLICTHGGFNSSKGIGKRNSGSAKNNCPAKIYAALTKDRTKIIIKQMIETHNHVIEQDLYKHYVQNRKLSNEEKAKVKELSRLGVTTKVIADEMRKSTGKSIVNKDIWNIKDKIRQKEKICPSSRNVLNVAELLVKVVEKRRESDLGLVSQYGMSDDNTLQYLFVQTSVMRSIFSKFPEHICIDTTYCLNNSGMPLVSFLCMDGNGFSHVIAFALIANESEVMLSQIFKTFKAYNASWNSIKTFMIDKDMSELTRLEQNFPNSFCEICLFHVKKAFKKKVADLSCTIDVKRKISVYLDTLCHSRDQSIYEKQKQLLLSLNECFAEYFLNNWDHMRDRWVFYKRATHLNFGDTTNNRIESYHQKLKSVITHPIDLHQCLEKIFFLNDMFLEECKFKQFKSLTKKYFSELSYLHNIITPYAIKHVSLELVKSTHYDLILPSNNTHNVIVGDNTYIVSEKLCNCKFFMNMCLPCRHLIAVSQYLGNEKLSLDWFIPRWHVVNNYFEGSPIPYENAKVENSNWRTPALDKIQKYKLIKVCSDKLVNKLVELGTETFQYYLKQLDKFEEMVSYGKRFEIFFEDQQVSDSKRTSISSENFVVGPGSSSSSVNNEPMESSNKITIMNEYQHIDFFVKNNQSPFIDDNVKDEVTGVQDDHIDFTTESMYQQEQINESLDVQRLKLIKPPLKVAKRGRPRGSGQTALGLTKKTVKRKCCYCKKCHPDKNLGKRFKTKWLKCTKCVRYFHDVCLGDKHDLHLCLFCIS
ncbi:uncharacterized protein LOC105846787 [Hydra vulgaris]|uniref:uncharacterized protein LOC105846787 n=1 Tax=Hydra vulgaris TaxID=6087 RepID=UPI001F5F9EB8|nr:uncharacterized protein LOC105846787 [Hydra vulgaris]